MLLLRINLMYYFYIKLSGKRILTLINDKKLAKLEIILQISTIRP